MLWWDCRITGISRVQLNCIYMQLNCGVSLSFDLSHFVEVEHDASSQSLAVCQL